MKIKIDFFICKLSRVITDHTNEQTNKRTNEQTNKRTCTLLLSFSLSFSPSPLHSLLRLPPAPPLSISLPSLSQSSSLSLCLSLSERPWFHTYKPTRIINPDIYIYVSVVLSRLRTFSFLRIILYFWLLYHVY